MITTNTIQARAAIGATIAAICFAVAACGSDDDSSSSEPAEAAEAESGDHEVVPASEVTEGYADMRRE